MLLLIEGYEFQSRKEVLDALGSLNKWSESAIGILYTLSDLYFKGSQLDKGHMIVDEMERIEEDYSKVSEVAWDYSNLLKSSKSPGLSQRTHKVGTSLRVGMLKHCNDIQSCMQSGQCAYIEQKKQYRDVSVKLDYNRQSDTTCTVQISSASSLTESKLGNLEADGIPTTLTCKSVNKTTSGTEGKRKTHQGSSAYNKNSTLMSPHNDVRRSAKYAIVVHLAVSRIVRDYIYDLCQNNSKRSKSRKRPKFKKVSRKRSKSRKRHASRNRSKSEKRYKSRKRPKFKKISRKRSKSRKRHASRNRSKSEKRYKSRKRPKLKKKSRKRSKSRKRHTSRNRSKFEKRYKSRKRPKFKKISRKRSQSRKGHASRKRSKSEKRYKSRKRPKFKKKSKSRKILKSMKRSKLSVSPKSKKSVRSRVKTKSRKRSESRKMSWKMYSSWKRYKPRERSKSKNQSKSRNRSKSKKGSVQQEDDEESGCMGKIHESNFPSSNLEIIHC